MKKLFNLSNSTNSAAQNNDIQLNLQTINQANSVTLRCQGYGFRFNLEDQKSENL